VNSTLRTGFEPPIYPPRAIDDPDDPKPDDWDDREQIEDLEAVEPPDWDENAPNVIPDPKQKNPPLGWLLDEPPTIPDPSARRPRDWDETWQGEWKPPMIPNPKCVDVPGCGPWRQRYIDGPPPGPWQRPLIPNPAYQGKYQRRQVPNPGFYEDPVKHNFPDIIGAGFELWIVTKDIGIGNVYIGDDVEAVKRWNIAHFIPKHERELGTNLNQPEVVRVEDILPKTTSTPWPTRTPPGLKRYDRALGDFWAQFKDTTDNLAKKSPELSFVLLVSAVLFPVALYLCAVSYRERRKRLLVAKHMEEIKKQKKKERKKKE
jgi:hypothetical protein